jgi:hypothetical protein
MSTKYNNINSKDIQYLNKDFTDYRQALIDFAKTYYPTTYNDFSPADPGTMFIEMAAYVGDVLSYYQDNQIQENFLQYAKEKDNLLTLAYMFGYKPKVTTAATTLVDIFQLLPSKLSSGNYVPDYDYALIIGENAVINSTTNANSSFITLDKVDFGFSSSLDPTEVSVYQINNTTNEPEYYLLKKSTRAISGEIKSTTFDFGAPTRFPSVNLSDTNIIKVLDVTDSDGNSWYETPYLAQETIFDEIQNIEQNDPDLSQYNGTVPYLLRLRRVPRRFVTRFSSNDVLSMEFGSGLSNSYAKLEQTLPPTNDETIIPNSDNVGLGLPEGISKLDTAFDPANFLYTEAYGVAPYNTTLTVRYIVGGGIKSNVGSNTLNTLGSLSITAKSDVLNPNLLAQVQGTLSVTNPKAAVGGEDGDSLDELRLNSIANFSSQLRAVTKDDYIVRVMSMSPRLGTVAKVYIEQDQALSKNDATDSIIDSNPLALSMYILGYNADKKLAQTNIALKRNIRNFLGQYRMLTDAVNIKDAYFININVNFDIIVLPNFSSNDVLNSCLNQLKSYFDISKWQINQPIVISEITNMLLKVKGVQNVLKLEFNNLSGGNYSSYGYDVEAAIRNNVLYPSLDPSIFEIRFPNTDIQGRVVNY